MKIEFNAEVILILSFGFYFNNLLINSIASLDTEEGYYIFQFQPLFIFAPRFFQFVISSLNGAYPINN